MSGTWQGALSPLEAKLRLLEHHRRSRRWKFPGFFEKMASTGGAGSVLVSSSPGEDRNIPGSKEESSPEDFSMESSRRRSFSPTKEASFEVDFASYPGASFALSRRAASSSRLNRRHKSMREKSRRKDEEGFFGGEPPGSSRRTPSDGAAGDTCTITVCEGNDGIELRNDEDIEAFQIWGLQKDRQERSSGEAQRCQVSSSHRCERTPAGSPVPPLTGQRESENPAQCLSKVSRSLSRSQRRCAHGSAEDDGTLEANLSSDPELPHAHWLPDQPDPPTPYSPISTSWAPRCRRSVHARSSSQPVHQAGNADNTAVAASHARSSSHPIPPVGIAAKAPAQWAPHGGDARLSRQSPQHKASGRRRHSRGAPTEIPRPGHRRKKSSWTAPALLGDDEGQESAGAADLGDPRCSKDPNEPSGPDAGGRAQRRVPGSGCRLPSEPAYVDWIEEVDVDSDLATSASPFMAEFQVRGAQDPSRRLSSSEESSDGEEIEWWEFEGPLKKEGDAREDELPRDASACPPGADVQQRGQRGALSPLLQTSGSSRRGQGRRAVFRRHSEEAEARASSCHPGRSQDLGEHVQAAEAPAVVARRHSDNSVSALVGQSAGKDEWQTQKYGRGGAGSSTGRPSGGTSRSGKVEFQDWAAVWALQVEQEPFLAPLPRVYSDSITGSVSNFVHPNPRVFRDNSEPGLRQGSARWQAEKLPAVAGGMVRKPLCARECSDSTVSVTTGIMEVGMSSSNSGSGSLSSSPAQEVLSHGTPHGAVALVRRAHSWNARGEPGAVPGFPVANAAKMVLARRACQGGAPPVRQHQLPVIFSDYATSEACTSSASDVDDVYTVRGPRARGMAPQGQVTPGPECGNPHSGGTSISSGGPPCSKGGGSPLLSCGSPGSLQSTGSLASGGVLNAAQLILARKRTPGGSSSSQGSSSGTSKGWGLPASASTRLVIPGGGQGAAVFSDYSPSDCCTSSPSEQEDSVRRSCQFHLLRKEKMSNLASDSSRAGSQVAIEEKEEKASVAAPLGTEDGGFGSKDVHHRRRRGRDEGMSRACPQSSSAAVFSDYALSECCTSSASECEATIRRSPLRAAYG